MEITINSAANPQWANADHTAINLDVDFDHLDEETVRFTATPDDIMEYGRYLYEHALAGDYGVIAAYIAPPMIIPPISKRQFLIVAALGGLITQNEALNADSVVPPAIAAVFDSLPSDQAFAARITWKQMTVLERHEPLVVAAAAAFGMTESQIDNFFLQAAAL